MSEGGYKIRNQAAIHFITFAVVEWVDVFTKKDYRDIVLESIRYCQKEKGLVLHSWSRLRRDEQSSASYCIGQK